MDLKILNENVWSMLFLPLFGCCGISLLFRCRFLPFRRFGVMLRFTILGRDEQGRGLTPFQAASTALAATVGTGNIIGTAQAVAMGGPGAVFWLWTAALLGMTIKYAEILQGLRFQNGAMGYISAALGRFPAGVYALLAAVSALTVGNMAQMNGAVQALCRVMGHEEMSLRLILGLVLTAMIGLGIRGGAGHVGRLMERLIPMMTLSYLILTGAAIFAFRARLPGVLLRIALEAFHPRAVLGAAGGIGLRQTILWGLRRGSFSNEAGLGTAANIHAFAESEEPAIHALWGIFEVFADTLVVCTATALVILCSGVPVPYGALPGAELLEKALALMLGNRAAGIYVALALLLFGLSTVIGCSVNAKRCAAWLVRERREGPFLFIYLACALLGCLLPMELIWHAADFLNVLMACPNLAALLILAPQTGKEVVDSFFASGLKPFEREWEKPEGNKKADTLSCPKGENGVQ